ncbi:MAG: ATP-binding cassette domain-containing protein [Neomegalonema sp.]|nr:ATP-binding cassette domain-containing protein [Neomegalonema sp.]
MARLRLSGLSKSWASADARFTLTVPAFELASGQTVALVGENGSGKSTLLELIGLAAAPDRAAGARDPQDAVREPRDAEPDPQDAAQAASFDLTLDGQRHDLLTLWRSGQRRALADLRARGFGYVLQTAPLLGALSVRANIAMAQQIAGREDAHWLDHLLAALGLSDRQAAHPASLSVGLRQRVAIARALAHRPRFILADEPTAALDRQSGEAALGLMIALAREEGIGLLLASHDHALIARQGLSVVETRLTHVAPGERRAVLLAPQDREGA